MDRGEKLTDAGTSADPGEDGVASETSARVHEVLASAERHVQALLEEAERDASAIARRANEDRERILDDARRAALAAARERAEALERLQASIAARGPSVVDGLEGAGLTQSRLEALVAALGAAARGIVAEAAVDAPAEPAAEPSGAADSGAPDSDPPASEDESAGGDGARADGETRRFEGPLPEGAPMARRPARRRDRGSDARFAAVLLAVQGRERAEVERHLRSEYGATDCGSILDEVFGRADAPA